MTNEMIQVKCLSQCLAQGKHSMSPGDYHHSFHCHGHHLIINHLHHRQCNNPDCSATQASWMGDHSIWMSTSTTLSFPSHQPNSTHSATSPYSSSTSSIKPSRKSRIQQFTLVYKSPHELWLLPTSAPTFCHSSPCSLSSCHPGLLLPWDISSQLLPWDFCTRFFCTQSSSSWSSNIWLLINI